MFGVRSPMISILDYHDLLKRLTLIFLYLFLKKCLERNEVAASGQLSPNTQTLPLSMISQQKVFEMDEDEFEIVCGFPKPLPDETIVFSCAAGIRSVQAAQWAAHAGYTKLVNYQGGAYEWFSGN